MFKRIKNLFNKTKIVKEPIKEPIKENTKTESDFIPPWRRGQHLNKTHEEILEEIRQQQQKAFYEQMFVQAKYYERSGPQSSQETFKRKRGRDFKEERKRTVRSNVNIIFTPEPKTYNRYNFKKRKLEDLTKNLSYSFGVCSVFSSNSINNLNSSNTYDTFYLEGTKQSLSAEIYRKLQREQITIVESKLPPHIWNYGIRWTLTKLIWECLKESQYIEFEEIENER